MEHASNLHSGKDKSTMCAITEHMCKETKHSNETKPLHKYYYTFRYLFVAINEDIYEIAEPKNSEIT